MADGFSDELISKFQLLIQNMNELWCIIIDYVFKIVEH